MTFSPAMRQAVTRTNRCFRAYLKLTSCNDDVLYIRSHDDVLTPDAETSTAGIVSLSISSQRVDFETSVTTIGDFNFRVIDFDDTLLNWMRSLDTCAPTGTRVQYFAGYEGVSCDDYQCVQTTVLSGVRFKNKGYNFSARDPLRQGRTDIFPEVCGKVQGNVYDPATPIGEREVVIIEGAEGEDDFLANTTLAREPSAQPGFITETYGTINIAMQEPFGGTNPRDLDGRFVEIKLSTCEIVRAQLQATREFGVVYNDAENTVKPAINVYTYRVLERGLYGTNISAVADNGSIISNGAQACEALVITGPAPEVLYQVLTGNSLDGTPQLAFQNHANIDPQYIKRDTFTQNANFFNSQLEFVCPPSTDAKAFWEEQILRWIDAYFLIDCEGRLCLTPHDEPTEDDNAQLITDHDIIRCGDIEEDWDVVTGYLIGWDKNPCEDEYFSIEPTLLGDGFLQEECLNSRNEICKFDGVRTDYENALSIRARACRWLSNRASPKWRLNLVLCIERGDLQPGDKVRVQTNHIHDYHSLTGRLDRVFEAVSASPDFQSGTVSVDLATRAKPPQESAYRGCIQETQPCGRNHCDGRTPLPITGGLIPNGTVLELEAGEYCHEGDLVIDGEIRLTTPGTFGLVVSGVLRGNGRVNTVGQGFPGRAGDRGGATIEGTGYGTNQSQGGVYVDCGQNRNENPDNDNNNGNPGEPGFDNPGNAPPGDPDLNNPDNF